MGLSESWSEFHLSRVDTLMALVGTGADRRESDISAFLKNKNGDWGSVRAFWTGRKITDIHLAGPVQKQQPKTWGGSRDSSGPLINYVQFPSLHLRAHTHLLAHPHSSCQDTECIQSVLQVCEGAENGEWWCKAFKMPKKEEVITAKGADCGTDTAELDVCTVNGEVASWDRIKW